MLDASVPDIVISDIGMPGQDGYEFVRELRRRESGSARRIPTIALTSFTRSQDQEQARLAGFDLHSSKPLRPHELVQQIRQLAGRTEARRATAAEPPALGSPATGTLFACASR
jgi:CheY-like chemotaxis protein